MRELLKILKRLIEEEITIPQWKEWWENNEKSIEKEENKLTYLLLKHKPIKGAVYVLDKHSVNYKLGKSFYQTSGGGGCRKLDFNSTKPVNNNPVEKVLVDELGWATCPNCHIRFATYDKSNYSWDGQRHISCQQLLILLHK